jgi:hypothetical protein
LLQTLSFSAKYFIYDIVGIELRLSDPQEEPRVSPKKKVAYTVLATIGILFLFFIGLMFGVELLNSDYTPGIVFKIIGVVVMVCTIASPFIIVDWLGRKFGEGGLFPREGDIGDGGWYC